MASLLEHVLINNIEEDIKDAIAAAGGDLTSYESPEDLARIIKEQLSRGAASTLVSGNGININKNDRGEYEISSNSDGELTGDLAIPYNIDQDSDLDFIKKGESIQDALGHILGDVLPKMPSVLQGDIIRSSVSGSDSYEHPLFQGVKTKTGLQSDTKYLRLFVYSRQEPLYISLKDVGNGSSGGGSVDSLTGDDIDEILNQFINPK